MRNGLLVMIISIILLASILFVSPLNCISQPIGWSIDVRLTNNTNNSVIPEIAAWDKYVHVFWCEQTPGPGTEYDLFYKRSSNGGKTWEGTIKLIDTPFTSINPSVVNYQNIIHLVWRDDRNSWLSAIYYMRSEDNGTTWTPEINISTPNAGTDEVDIALWGNKIYVVYTDYTYGINGFQLYFIRSEDNGNTWSVPKNITGKNRDSCHPRIAVNGSNIHVVWLDHYDKNGQGTAGAIFYMNSTDGGLTWSEDINLTEMGLDAAYPDIAINGSTIHVVYYKEEGGIWRGYYRQGVDNGISWTDEILFSDPEGVVYAKPKIASSSNILYLIWPDNRDGKWELYFKSSSNNGDTWSESLRLTYDDAGSTTQNIATTTSNIHVVWRDDRNGYPDIYYKHYPVPYPPTNLTIDIQGTNLTLNWTTPQNSPSPMDHYLIYRSTTWNGIDFSSPWVDTSIDFDNGIIPLRTSWNDTTALLDESNNYFYIVRAIDAEGWNDTNTNIVGKFVIPLKAGWNLFSMPLAQKNSGISEVLKSIDGKYNIVYWYDSKDGIWHSSPTGLTDINRTMGLWIHMKNACNLSIVGAVPESTDIALYEGWNLVGYPGLKARDLSDALNSITWQAVQQYNAFDANDPWKHNCTKKPDSLNDLKEMKPGCGYWVYVAINDTWVRTRTSEDNKVIIWRVGESEEKILNNQPIYEPIIENPIEMEPENDYQVNIVPEQPTEEVKEESYAVSLIPLIIFIALIFTEIMWLYKKKK